ncbi:aldo/keto reductase [Plectosphaerella cucumerina]|uniref:Aldo/keto reductase n=1 Tax=Plectosphaerella cucumerina TaxID=40658 RepID=A0A8K0T543_9PEZI|nr:aldo/keto reductase [Plectosphaerella cucumerina]
MNCVGLPGLLQDRVRSRSDEERLEVLDRAWEIGARNWDSADAYGDNEDLLGKWFAQHRERRQDIFLASKFAGKVERGSNGELLMEFDSSPEYAREACERSLKRLGVESIDLYYIHRLDGKTPIEKTIGEMAKLKSEGKIKHLGIFECSSQTLRRAYAIHPISAIQVEYSPWTLDIEKESGTNLLLTARELGVSVFVYSPLGSGIMTGQYRLIDDFDQDDYRRLSPRYQPQENFQNNLGDDIIPIPGTKKIKYLDENFASLNVKLSEMEGKELRALVDVAEVAGSRGLGHSKLADTPDL